MCRLSVHLARYEEGQAGVMERKSPPIWTTAREDFISHKLTPKLAQQLKVSYHLIFSSTLFPFHAHADSQWTRHVYLDFTSLNCYSLVYKKSNKSKCQVDHAQCLDQLE